MVHILAISGSLRARSLNTTLLHALPALAPTDVSIAFYDGLAELPHFNPDREDEALPAVLDLRHRLDTADGVLICSPEYAHGVPGSLKNALDWVVGSGEFMAKPVALINASPYSTFAQAQLAETLKTMDAQVISEASITVPLRGKKLDATGVAQDPEIAAALSGALAAFVAAIQAGAVQKVEAG